MNRYEELRAKHPRFVYSGFELSENRLEFDFQIGEYRFRPFWTFEEKLDGVDRVLLEELAFSLGMAELVSYWKCACCPVVEVRCGSLDEWQINWWKKLYWGGLGEFFYRNGITADFDSFMTIETMGEPRGKFSESELSGVLIPVGGGKDSVVTLELLKASCSERISAYVINPNAATLGCADTAGIPVKGVRRTIDKTLLELNAKGYLNGHTPFSAVVAFSSLFFGTLSGVRYNALSNESSANETYVEGAPINHQYSKSTEFERDFREYCARTFGAGVPEYFSLLRPLSEWQIAREFVKYPQYFKIFRSCNLGSKTGVWCCNCAKCLYIYILLAAFLDDDRLEEIFGCNMLEKEELASMLDGLMLDGEDKPFECVGTKNEVRLSLKMALDRRKKDPPVLLKRFAEKLPDCCPPSLDGFFDKDNFVPEKFLPLLEKIANEH